MKNENFAERLFCDLRNADVKLEKPYYEVGGVKIGTFDTIQFNICGCRNKFQFNKGTLSINTLEDFNITFTEAYGKLLIELMKFKTLKFYSLAIPMAGKNVDVARLDEFVDVVSRYIYEYNHITDDMYERWDVLVSTI